MHRTEENLSRLTPRFPAEVDQVNALPPCFSSYCKQMVYLMPHFSHLCALLLVISVFKMSHKYSVKMLSSVPKCEKAVRCLTEKIHVLLRLCSGISYGAIGSEFNFNALTICIH